MDASLAVSAANFSGRLRDGARSVDLISVVREWRASCAASPAAQTALVDARAAQLLVAYLLVCEADCAAAASEDGSGGSGIADAARARRVGWQALVNLCAGTGAPECARTAVFRAIARGTGAQCALESGARAGITDTALADVVLCAVHTSTRGSTARLRTLATRARLLLPLLRLAAPAGGGSGADGRLACVEADDSAVLGVRSLAADFLEAGLFPAALATARRGLSAAALIDTPGVVSGEVVGGGGGITTEATILLHAVALSVESALYAGAAAGRHVTSRREVGSALDAALAAASSAVANFFVDAASGALAMPKTDAGHSALGALHVGLCVRAAHACANLLGDSIALQSNAAEAQNDVAQGFSDAAVSRKGSEEAGGADSESTAAASGALSSDDELGPPDAVDTEAHATQFFPPPRLAASLVQLLVASSPRAAAPAPAPAGAASTRSLDDVPSELRTSLVRCIALFFSRKTDAGSDDFVSEAVREGVTTVLLAQTALHEHTITLREWAMLATRELAQARGESGDIARAEIVSATATARGMQAKVDEVGRAAAK